MRVDSPGLDVGDGPLDHLADPVDALVGLLRRLAQLSVGGLLAGRDHSPSHVSLVGDPPGGDRWLILNKIAFRGCVMWKLRGAWHKMCACLLM